MFISKRIILELSTHKNQFEEQTSLVSVQDVLEF